jgi:hypothetical protein
MRRHLVPVMALAFLVVVGAAACDKGPMQRTGEKID